MIRRLMAGLTVAALGCGFAPMVFAQAAPPQNAAAPATPQAMPKDGKELCLQCHGDFAPQLQGKVVHKPVADDRCTACHNPHVARFPKLLMEQGQALCLGCHAKVQAEIDQPVRHGALRHGAGCGRCHKAHASDRPALLTDSMSALCVSCHADVAAALKLAQTHAPAAKGDCGACHLPHGGPEPALLEKKDGAICQSCHPPASAALKGSHHQFALDQADCSSCHEPHGAAKSGLLRPVLHAPFEAGCDACHASPGKPRDLTTAQPALCVGCHTEQESYAKPSATSHPIRTGVACTGCHSPHAGEGASLMRGPERLVCLGCHVEIRRAIDRGVSSHPISVDEGRCTVCHDAHDAKGGRLLKKPEDELCLGCHASHAQFAHPMGANVPDPSRPGKHVNCLSCHDPHASGQPMLLLASPKRELCLRCHKELHR